ncbi:RING finger protein 112-like [Bufo gargarizans]|uniref:RING finger protein 112-like n=1 Tax=Bufo gargarizans TaxID=30331 RepID=UPI001CF36012|nr:RING finger protein 112-like [Bufo gargarizans]
MERDFTPGFTIFYDSSSREAGRRREFTSICPLCNKETKKPITISCGHTFCWSCYHEYEEAKGQFGYSCPSCINQEPDEPLQLVSVDENGLLVLQERVLYSCFLGRRIEEYPVYVISVIGERRRGKSFLMNYLIKALQSQETAKEFDLGAEDEILKGFPWKPGTDRVTYGIWIWSKPFILERNGQKVAVFLLDTEGSMDMEGDRKAYIKMCMLTMLLSSHLICNVNNDIKETDIDYLELYCDGINRDKLDNLKYFDFLIRNWHDPKKCTANDAKSYMTKETEKMKNRYKNCNFLAVLRQCSSECFLMPHPGTEITSKETGRLKDMNKEFQDSLRTYLSGVVERVQLNIGPADHTNTLTCSEMFQMMTVFVSYINDLKYNISSPLEMYNMRKNQERMEEIKNEFQKFLSSWPMWRLRIGDTVAEKISELQKEFEQSFRGINEEDRKDLLEKLKEYLLTEGDKFCRSHNIKLLINGVPVGLALIGAVNPAAARVAFNGAAKLAGWILFRKFF